MGVKVYPHDSQVDMPEETLGIFGNQRRHVQNVLPPLASINSAPAHVALQEIADVERSRGFTRVQLI